MIKNILLFLVIVTTLTSCCIDVSASDIYVPDDYATIQEAIDNTIAGDNVIIRDGTYVENISIGTSISLRSENGSDHVTIRATSNTSRAITTTTQVNISGCHIELSKSGIYLDTGSGNSNISENVIEDSSEYGIYVKTSDDCVIMNNTISGCDLDAIYLNNADNCNVSSNNASFNFRGVYIASSVNNIVDTNTICNNSVYGIVLLFANTNTIYNNYFSGNGDDYLITFSTSSYNITKTPGENIVGGPYLGGNYWSDYTGNDTDVDGIGDTGTIPFGPGDYLPLVPYSSPTAPSNIYIVTQMRTAYVTWSTSTSSNTLQPLHYHWNTTNTTGTLQYDVTTNTYSGAIPNLYPGYYNFSVNATDNTTFSSTVRTEFFMTNTLDMTLQQPVSTNYSNYGIIGVTGLFAIPFLMKNIRDFKKWKYGDE